MKKSLLIVLSLVMLGLMSCDGTGSGASGNGAPAIITGIPTEFHGIWGCTGELEFPGTGVTITVAENSITMINPPQTNITGISHYVDSGVTRLVSSSGQSIGSFSTAGILNIAYFPSSDPSQLNGTWHKMPE